MDTRGEPLIGATIMIHGTSEGTSTDQDGNFSLEAAEGDLIDALLIGYRTVSQKAAARLDFVLEDDITQLEEVVVVGYGVQKKVNLTGSVESLGGEAMENLPMPSLSRGLQGMIPSLNIDMTDGKPIRSSEYNVRGTTSIGAGGGSTLIMIDGAPGDPDLLNPGDIESVTVLKDAASAAIYGARGPFGVVLITTKNPSAGKTSVTYSGNVSFYTQTQHNDYIWDGYTWAKSFVEAYYAYNDYVTNPTGVNNAFPFTPNLETYLSELKRRHDDPSLPKVALTEDGKYLYYGSTNWYDELYKKVSSGTEHTLTLSGSARNVGYYLSGRYYGQRGIFKYNSDDFNQFNLRGKGYIQIFPWLKVSDNVDFSWRSYKYPLTSIYEKGIWRNIADQGFPMAVMYNPDGTMTRHAAYTVGDFKTGYNKSLSSQFNLRNTVNLTASFLNNSLRVNGDFTYSYRFSRDKRILYPVSYSDYQGVVTSEGTNKLSEQLNETNYIGTNVYAEYERTFRDSHYFKAMAGINYEYQKVVANYMERNGILKPNIADFN
ncbi:MAG: TonB-dependent receptor plug domain-containing protein, partial [Bacteroidales bacterium]|nr:TonB-dependent receptor plug domain-containing protein [Bacteroidales bacterium]